MGHSIDGMIDCGLWLMAHCLWIMAYSLAALWACEDLWPFSLIYGPLDVWSDGLVGWWPYAHNEQYYAIC